MENALMTYAISQGIFCALYVFLFVWFLKENKEEKTALRKALSDNQSIMSKFAEAINDGLRSMGLKVDDIDECGESIHDDLTEMKPKVDSIHDNVIKIKEEVLRR